jgi:hypothetical protein
MFFFLNVNAIFYKLIRSILLLSYCNNLSNEYSENIKNSLIKYLGFGIPK